MKLSTKLTKDIAANLEVCRIIFPDIKHVLVPDMPNDLTQFVDEMRKVKRYADPEYVPENCIKDDVFLHTQRLIIRFKSLDLNGVTEIERMLWIHDFEELGFPSDKNMVRKNIEGIGSSEVPIEMLGKADNNLIGRFNKVGSSLKRGEGCDDDSACLAKVIDFIENPLVFHHGYTKWLLAGNFWDENVPPTPVFTFTFIQNGKFRQGINASHISAETKMLCLDLLNKQLSVTTSIWSKVSSKIIPEVQKLELKKMKAFLRDGI